MDSQEYTIHPHDVFVFMPGLDAESLARDGDVEDHGEGDVPGGLPECCHSVCVSFAVQRRLLPPSPDLPKLYGS